MVFKICDEIIIEEAEFDTVKFSRYFLKDLCSALSVVVFHQG